MVSGGKNNVREAHASTYIYMQNAKLNQYINTSTRHPIFDAGVASGIGITNDVPWNEFMFAGNDGFITDPELPVSEVERRRYLFQHPLHTIGYWEYA